MGGFFMQKSKINMLLEEIAIEIKAAENKNRELYSSAIDIEDEEQSLKIQRESYNALRNMKGLKSAMETFRAQLEKSGILKYDSDEIEIEIEKVNLKEEKSSKIEAGEGDEIFISHEHSPIVVPAEPEKEADKKEAPQDDDDDSDSDELPKASYINEEIVREVGTVSGIIDELSKSMVQINSDSDNDNVVDDMDDLDDYASDLDGLKANFENLEKLSDSREQSSEQIEPIKFNEPKPELDDDLGDLVHELNDLANSLEDLDDLDDMNDSDELGGKSGKSFDSFDDDFSFDFDDGINFDEVEFAGDEDKSKNEEKEEKIEIEEIKSEEKPVEPVVSVAPAPVPVPLPVAVKEESELEPKKEPDTDDDFSGFGMSAEVGIYSSRTPAKFSMFGRKVDVRDWADMLVKVCEILILKNPYTVAQFDKYHDLNPLGNTYFSYSQGEIQHVAKKLSNGLWIELQRSPDDIVMLCKKILELCGYPRSELEIEFAD
jgi:hypothetical protein